ncbi:uncharacterized protein [Rhodnius prolixus]|uniref:uncharacterized protein n=1 Tax=Rhodnius prolixus TaxID=13249 RepID=UPI003D188FEC
MLQEPWTREEKVLGKPAGTRVFAQHGAGIRPRAAIIVSRGLHIWRLAEFSSEDSTAVSVSNLHSFSSSSFNVVVASVYFPHDDESPPLVVRRLIDYCSERRLPLVIGCDANAHHTAWGSSDVNSRGEALLEYLMSTNLVWCNRGHKPTFVTRSRREVLDLTLVSSDIVDLVSGWDVSDIPSLSDHCLIKFSLRGEVELPEERPIKQTNWESFRLSLASTIGNLKVEVGTEVRTDRIDSDCQRITEALITAFHNACPLRAGFSTKRTCAWWSPRLAQLRSQARRAQSRAMRTQSLTAWNTYRNAQSLFKSEIRRAKQLSWKIFLQFVGWHSAFG